jgi:hypothetical protein
MRKGKELMLKANVRPTLRIQEPAGKAHHLDIADSDWLGRFVPIGDLGDVEVIGEIVPGVLSHRSKKAPATIGSGGFGLPSQWVDLYSYQFGSCRNTITSSLDWIAHVDNG